MSHVFLSYSHQDLWTMRLVATYLRQSGFEVWVDEKLTPGSADWQQKISEAIKAAGCLVVILSPEAATSKWVINELTSADERQIPIIPLLAVGSPADSIPLSLKSALYLDIRKNYSAKLSELGVLVGQHVPKTLAQQKGLAVERVGSVFWLSSDLRRLRWMLTPEAFSLNWVKALLLQVQHHAQRLGMDKVSLSILAEIIAKTEGYQESDWTPERRATVQSELRAISRSIAHKLEEIEGDFETGPINSNRLDL